eukprot:CAMPEP_0180252052 /NCGR_PEP_ID=MMETSP0987-20121128/38787_1 /TAXON_ID=697907 /ORGANISM="non described non described, Strain CCMP2293" /LENGTH=101 /DNA_ID=CAMNT_0022220679 /DNA_START=15 /DNA_END=317 /DNA_ORIENTATION=+
MAPPVLVSGALEDAAALDRARKLEIWRAQKAAAAADKDGAKKRKPPGLGAASSAGLAKTMAGGEDAGGKRVKRTSLLDMTNSPKASGAPSQRGSLLHLAAK